MNISKNVKYVGVNDHEIDLFEGQYVVPNGMAYNSYAISGEKTAILDTVESNFVPQWLENIENATEINRVILGGEQVSEKWMCNLQ